MNRVLERAKAHLAGQERQRIEVAEWGEDGKPLIVTFTALTVAERRKIFKADRQGNPPDGATVCVRAVIHKACDEKGKRLFDEMEEHDLSYNVDSGVIGRVAGPILAGAKSDESAIEAEKNG